MTFLLLLLMLQQATPVPACDVNGDGVFNVADLQTILNTIMLGNVPACRACDLNKDNAVNVLDLQDAVNIITGTMHCKGGLQLEVTGGTPPFTWVLVSGGLPPGMTLSTLGVISGIPTRVGTFIFTVWAVDSVGVHAEKQFTLVVNP